MASIGDDEILGEHLIQKVIKHFQAMKPLADFLNRAIDA
jgi:hypothetical protein